MMYQLKMNYFSNDIYNLKYKIKYKEYTYRQYKNIRIYIINTYMNYFINIKYILSIKQIFFIFPRIFINMLNIE